MKTLPRGTPVVPTEDRQRVVVRYTSGRVLRGYLPAADKAKPLDKPSDHYVVEGCDGKTKKVGPSDIKAVFFVKSFEGNKDYSEFKVFSARPSGQGVWVRVQFRDSEMIEGVAPNDLDTYSKATFYMTPPDPASNNQAVLVSKRFLKEMEILGLASEKTPPRKGTP